VVRGGWTSVGNTPHLIARNGSTGEPLRFIMTFIVAAGQPTALPLDERAASP